MISGKQLKQVLDYSFAGGTAFLAPTASFTANPSTYTSDSVPGTVTLSGSIIPNDGTSITWTITQGGVTLASGSGTAVSHNLVSIPNTVGNNIYNLNVNYMNGVNNYSITVTSTVEVTAAGKVGQLPGPTDDITVAGDLTTYESGLTIKTKAEAINLFAITAANTGKIVIVVPDSWGTLTTIQDENDASVLNEFDVVVDSGNSRKIYVKINTVTPGTYNYKLVY